MPFSRSGIRHLEQRRVLGARLCAHRDDDAVRATHRWRCRLSTSRTFESVLGTTDADLPAPAARATVTGTLPAAVVKGSLHGVHRAITNEGDAAWPVSVPRFGVSFIPLHEGRVTLRATWRHASAAAASPVVFTIQLPRDVRAHETVHDVIALPTPPDPGPYDLEIAVAQANGTGFAPPDSQSLAGRVEVR